MKRIEFSLYYFDIMLFGHTSVFCIRLIQKSSLDWELSWDLHSSVDLLYITSLCHHFGHLCNFKELLLENLYFYLFINKYCWGGPHSRALQFLHCEMWTMVSMCQTLICAVFSEKVGSHIQKGLKKFWGLTVVCVPVNLWADEPHIYAMDSSVNGKSSYPLVLEASQNPHLGSLLYTFFLISCAPMASAPIMLNPLPLSHPPSVIWLSPFP